MELGDADRRILARLGVRFGLLHLYVAELLKPAANEARACSGCPAAARPSCRRQAGRCCGPRRRAARDLLAVGFAGFGGFALRVDILERVAARVAPRQDAPRGSRRRPRSLPRPAWRDELGVLVAALGLPAPDGAGGGTAEFTACPGAASPPGRPAAPTRRAADAGSPFAALARLKAAPEPWRRRPAPRQMAVARAVHPQPRPRRGSRRGAAGAGERPTRRQDAQLVRPGDVVTLTEPARVQVVRVRALGERRGPAVEARLLYEEITRLE